MCGRAFRAVVAEMRSRRTATRWSARVQLAYLLGIIATWLLLISRSEQWLPATMLAYGPRAVVILPLAIVLPAGALFARRSLLFGSFGAWLAISQIMGFRFTMASAEPPTRSPQSVERDLRIITLNAAADRMNRAGLDALVARHAPDIVALQECSADVAASLATLQGWHTARHHGLCTFSRWPISAPDSMPREDLVSIADLGFGGTALVVRYVVQHPTRPFQLVNLHLETARKGLQGLLGSDGLLPDAARLPSTLPFTRGADRVDANALIRRRESQRASAWAARDVHTMPVIVVGDFNLPVESTIYRESWQTWLNAFESKGRGFGYTKSEGTLLRIRIDHVLAAPQWFDVTGVWLGSDVGSDHRPVIADLVLVEMRG